MFAEVIIDIASEKIDRVFTYKVPAQFENCILRGSRVRVPFGYREKEGIVLRTKQEADYDPDKVKEILEPLDEYPAVLPALLELAEEIREQTHCTLAEALRLMIPAQMRGGRVRIKTRPYVQLNFPAERAEEAIQAQSRAPRRKLILSVLSDGKAHPVEELRALLGNIQAPLEELVRRELVRRFELEVHRSPEAMKQESRADVVTLTDEQNTVLEELFSAVAQAPSRGRNAFLLHGVTGSGKTEVFIRLTRMLMEQGRSVIILVPEIVLTPQMIAFFRNRFGESMAVLHSRLSPGERYDEWRRIRLGQAGIVIGARSAVFAPVQDLGAIIIDEEHEQSYLSDRFPAYDARKIALSRAGREGGIVLLASATPSMLSYARARRGDYVLLEMNHRVHERPLPEVHIVDMRRELKNGNRSMFSLELQQKLKACLDEGQQAILFLNRRGYAPFVNCRSCGETLKCENCDVSMTLHMTDHMLHCHYCGAVRSMPKVCPSCGSGFLKACGTGTQKVEEELHKLFPSVSSVRMDLDSTAGKNAHMELLNRFRARQAQVLIGTQMIAKGLDFPSVTLVGAVLADLTLNLPDYRAPERTYQLLVQVAGRAGRGDRPGQVVIQTYKPDHYVITAAAAQDYRAYFNDEFSRRRQKLYPPFTRIVRLLLEGGSASGVMNMAEYAAHTVERFLQDQPPLRRKTLFIRADEAPIPRINNKMRAQTLFKLLESPEADTIITEIQRISRELEEKSEDTGIHAILEIDPASMV